MVAKEAFCTRCERTVYIGDDDGDGCPVCSTPLVEQASIAGVLAPPATA